MPYIFVESVTQGAYWKRVSDSDYQKHMAICRSGVNCKMCERYPCFRGIDTMSSNLAVTCHDFHDVSPKPFNVR